METHCLEEHGLLLSAMPALVPRTATSTDLEPAVRVSTVNFDKLKNGQGVLVEQRKQGSTVVSIDHILQPSEQEPGKWKMPVERKEDLDEETRLVRERKARAEKGSLLLLFASEY
jgi:hypothetical protein